MMILLLATIVMIVYLPVKYLRMGMESVNNIRNADSSTRVFADSSAASMPQMLFLVILPVVTSTRYHP